MSKENVNVDRRAAAAGSLVNAAAAEFCADEVFVAVSDVVECVLASSV